MNSLKEIVFNPLWFSVIMFAIAVLLIYVKITKMNLRSFAVDKTSRLVVWRMRKDKEKTWKFEQSIRLGEKKSKMYLRYRDLIRGVIISLKLGGVSVENFTTMFLVVGLVVFVGTGIFLDSFILGVLVATPSVIALMAGIVAYTKNSTRAHDNRVMDALDTICPMVDSSVKVAIQKCAEGIDPKLRGHFLDFVADIDIRGLSFKEAIGYLNQSLGPRFDYFAEKAVIFEGNATKGANQVFLDIIEMNRITRSINARTDVKFASINRNRTGAIAILLVFMSYVYLAPLSSDVMFNSMVGKIATALCMTILLMMYGVNQLWQSNIDYDSIRE